MEGGGLEMPMNKEVIIDSQFILLKQFRVFLIFVSCPSKSPRVNSNFNITISPLLEGSGFSLQQKKVRLYMGILIIQSSVKPTSYGKKRKWNSHIFKNVTVLGAT